MEDVTYIRKTETRSLKGDRIILYYFVEERRHVKAGISYAAGIDMYTQMPGERTIMERKVSGAVFKTKKEAECFIDMLSLCSVTPTTLEDVVADYTADYTENIEA